MNMNFSDFIIVLFCSLDIIDPAVLRPGRMDKILYVGIPSADDRTAILTTITKVGRGALGRIPPLPYPWAPFHSKAGMRVTF